MDFRFFQSAYCYFFEVTAALALRAAAFSCSSLSLAAASSSSFYFLACSAAYDSAIFGQTVKCLLPMAAMCGQGVRARAAKAMRKRQAKYRSRCSVRSPRATHRPRRGRPFASPLRRGGKTSGVGRRDRRNTVRQWLAQCGQLARSSAALRGSRVHAGAKAALRGLSTRSELARTALKNSRPWPNMGSSSGPSLSKNTHTPL